MPDQNHENHDTTIAVMANDIAYIKQSVDDLRFRLEEIDRDYIRKSEADERTKQANEIHNKIFEKIDHLQTFKTRATTLGAVGMVALGVLQWALAVFM